MIVKKYSNRRLYDTEASRYITLEELAERIREGADARVLDAKSGEDLTQATLAQIILESRGAAKLLPTPLLTRLVRMGDDSLAEFFGQFMSWSLELYLQAKQGMMPYNPFASFGFGGNPFARALSTLNPFSHEGAKNGGREEPNAEPASGAADEVKELRKELEELKKLVRAERPKKR